MTNINRLSAVWCYSIYGDDTSKYYVPMLRNIELAKDCGATLVLHTNQKSESCVRRFFGRHLDETLFVVHNDECSECFPKILRYLTVKNIYSDFYFFKDSDSIVTQKEIEIMNKWMCTKNPVALIIRDHPLHISPILAGMFGVVSNLAQFIVDSAEEFFIKQKPDHYNEYSYDQDWLAKRIYPAIIDKAEVSTSFFYYRDEKFSRIKRELNNNEYIGAQAYKQSLLVTENIDGYLKLYGDDLLSLPYYPKFGFLYGRVRPTLAAAYLYSRFLKNCSNR